MSPTDRAPRENWCYAVPLRGGRWGACQVLGLDKDSGVDVVAFDLVTAKPPTLNQLAKAKPLVLDHHSHTGAEQRSWVSGPVPLEFEIIGERAPVMRTKPKQPSYAHWTSFDLQIRLQHRWDHEIPMAEIKRYRAGDTAVTLGETTPLPGYSCSVGECAGATYPWPASQPVPWQAFDVAGALTKLTYYGSDAGVLKYVASRKLVRELTWREHGQSRIDFRGASLSTLRVDAARSLKIWGAKNDAWIAANADNPLRDWVDADECFGDQACKIFSRQYRAAIKRAVLLQRRRCWPTS